MLEIKKLKFVDFKVQGVKGNEEEGYSFNVQLIFQTELTIFKRSMAMILSIKLWMTGIRLLDSYMRENILYMKICL